MAFTPVDYIASYFGWTRFTPALPSFYWNIYSAEERVKKMCLELHKLCEYANMLADNINIDHTIIKELQDAIGNIENLDEIHEQVEALQETADTIELILTNINILYKFDTVAQMTAFDGFVENDICATGGFLAINDGGGAIYTIVPRITANDFDTFDVGDNLSAVLLSKQTKEVNIEQLGAGLEGSNDSAILQYALNTYKIVRCTRQITLTNQVINDAARIVELDDVVYSGNEQCFLFNTSNTSLFVRNFYSNSGGYLEVNSATNFTEKHVYLNCANHVYIIETKNGNITHCKFEGYRTFIYTAENSAAIFKTKESKYISDIQISCNFGVSGSSGYACEFLREGGALQFEVLDCDCESTLGFYMSGGNISARFTNLRGGELFAREAFKFVNCPNNTSSCTITNCQGTVRVGAETNTIAFDNSTVAVYANTRISTNPSSYSYESGVISANYMQPADGKKGGLVPFSEPAALTPPFLFDGKVLSNYIRIADPTENLVLGFYGRSEYYSHGVFGGLFFIDFRSNQNNKTISVSARNGNENAITISTTGIYMLFIGGTLQNQLVATKLLHQNFS